MSPGIAVKMQTKLFFIHSNQGLATGRATRPGNFRPGFFRPGEKYNLNPEPGPDLKFSLETDPDAEFAEPWFKYVK